MPLGSKSTWRLWPSGGPLKPLEGCLNHTDFHQNVVQNQSERIGMLSECGGTPRKALYCQVSRGRTGQQPAVLAPGWQTGQVHD